MRTISAENACFINKTELKLAFFLYSWYVSNSNIRSLKKTHRLYEPMHLKVKLIGSRWTLKNFRHFFHLNLSESLKAIHLFMVILLQIDQLLKPSFLIKMKVLYRDKLGIEISNHPQIDVTFDKHLCAITQLNSSYSAYVPNDLFYVPQGLFFWK